MNISIDKIILPNKPLSNYDLMQAAKDLKIKNFRGVFLRDELPNKPRKNECGILNLADSKDLEGTHWTCYYKNYYFDSYGIQPPVEIIKYLGSNINYNTFQIQDFNQVVCGHLCLYVLLNLNKGKDFNDIILTLI